MADTIRSGAVAMGIPANPTSRTVHPARHLYRQPLERDPRLAWVTQTGAGAGVMYRRPAGKAEDKRKRAPPVRLGRRILTHLRRWQRLDGGKACDMQQPLQRKAARPHAHHARPRAIERVRSPDGYSRQPHTLRHTRATWLMQAGIDPWEAASALGMTIQMISQHYGHHHPDFQKRAAEV